jgi:hypothetical protein
MSVANALDNEPFTTDGVGLIDSEYAEAFFHDYHAELKSMGVDGVKVDAQSIVPLLVDPRGQVNGDQISPRGEGGWQRSFR